MEDKIIDILLCMYASFGIFALPCVLLFIFSIIILLIDFKTKQKRLCKLCRKIIKKIKKF